MFLDPMQLERIILNLVLNARDAILSGGPIRIVVSGSPVDHPGMVSLSVSDRGTGIEPAVLERIFDPLFTTKSNGKGSGLGLAIVRRFVELAGGSVAVETVVGKGTTIRVILPRAGSVG